MNTEINKILVKYNRILASYIKRDLYEVEKSLNIGFYHPSDIDDSWEEKAYFQSLNDSHFWKNMFTQMESEIFETNNK